MPNGPRCSAPKVAELGHLHLNEVRGGETGHPGALEPSLNVGSRHGDVVNGASFSAASR
jgi:hypothetical protein